MKPSLFYPKLLTTLRTYNLKIFWSDLSAGVIVGIVALPLAIAFAIASGVTPDRGLTTAIIAGFLISCLGGSRVQIGGPTGAFVVIVYGIVQRHGLDGLLLCTLMAGIMLVAMGLLRLGSVIKFIPYPVVIGFTSGIAVVIFSSQIKDFFGLTTAALPADFIEKWEVYFSHFQTLNLAAVALSVLSFGILLFWPRFSRKIPGSIMAILVVTALVHFFQIPVETIGSRFGDLPSGLPTPHWPEITFLKIKTLMIPAFTVALLGSIESLLSATVADGMIEGRHRSNTELIAQGIANIVTPFFGGLPATGAIARTATNVRNGGKTPIAGIIHAFVLFLFVLFLGHWVTMIPLCVLAAILILVSYHMSEWHAFKALLKAPRMDVAVLVITFFLTVFMDLTIAVEIGLLLSLVVFMKRMSDVTSVREVTDLVEDNGGEEELRTEEGAISRRKVPDGVVVYEAEGAFFFGAAELLRDTLDVVQQPPKVLILRMRHVLTVDATGLRALKDLHHRCRGNKTRLIIAGIHTQPFIAMDHSGILEEIGSDNVFKTIDEALVLAREVVSSA
ncbi:MAG: sulfate permease [bacterium]|nr:sulfate permease [bacterium]